MALTTVTTRPYVLACETPLLRGETLCPFLKKMDDEEFPLLDNDHKEELRRNGLWKSTAIRDGLMYGGAGVACIIGGNLLWAAGSRKKEKNVFDTDPSYDIGGFVVMAIGVALLFRAVGFPLHTKFKLDEKLNSDIVDERLCRLKNKIRIIDVALLEASSDINKGQLLKVRDFFDLNLSNILVDKTNVINVKVNKC